MSGIYEIPTTTSHGHPGVTLNRGWGWNWTGRERATGRVRTYYTRTSFGTKSDLREAMAYHFKGIDFIDGGPADREPAVVFPMPPHSFQHGILDAIAAELRGQQRPRLNLPLPRVRMAARPLLRHRH